MDTYHTEIACWIWWYNQLWNFCEEQHFYWSSLISWKSNYFNICLKIFFHYFISRFCFILFCFKSKKFFRYIKFYQRIISYSWRISICCKASWNRIYWGKYYHLMESLIRQQRIWDLIIRFNYLLQLTFPSQCLKK